MKLFDTNSKKGMIGNAGGMQLLLAAGIFIIILGIVFGLGGKVIGDIGADAASGSALANSTAYAGETINDMASYLPLLGLIFVIVVILGLLLTYLYGRFVK